MEDVLEVYHRQYRDNEVLVCLDETSKQQVKETRLGRPPRPGAAGSYNYEYERNGVSNLFMLFAPLEGWRRVEVTERRTRLDWAEVVRKLVDEDYADRERIVLVMDNLNTHHPSSLYEAFEPAEARRIAERLEIHYTPKHGSWLNMAEIEIGVMTRQCLDRRIPDRSVLRREAAAWQAQRNRDGIRVDWRFTTADARIKLKSLYPSIQRWRTTRTAASSESVFASFPVALAKSRTLRGLTTTTGTASAVRAATNGSSKPPEASSRTMTGSRVFSRATSCLIPASSWETRHLSSAGRMATSTWALATSMPT